ncbi:MAG: heme lyase NrfEFG subunit NrfE, partial [Rhodobacteraceae bacterium]|nr:heme lyase NrfEFG subunit NrfE [Paracoccaceae bacterium]
AFVVLIGTLWPLFSDLVFEKRVSVGAPYFNIAFTPFFVAIAMVLPVGAMLSWKRAKLNQVVFSLWPALILGVVLGAIVWSFQTGGRILGPVGVSLATWLICGALTDIWARARGSTATKRIRRLLRGHRSDFGKCVAHCGLGIIIFGISAITAWETEDIRIVSPGEKFNLGQYEFQFLGVRQYRNQNFMTTQGEFRVDKDGKFIDSLLPEKRFYPVAGIWTTEAAIDQSLLRDLYLVLGEEQDDGKWTVRTYVKPFAIWIWLGALCMALGGILSISDRRFRFSAGSKKVL